MNEAVFDIFLRAPNGDAIWIESAIGLSKATERMRQIAAESPGEYFISSIGTRSPIAQVETSGQFHTFQSPSSSSASHSAA